MKIIYKNQEIEVWEISKAESFPAWVQTAFDKNQFQWDGKQLKILLNMFRPSALRGLTSFGSGIQVIYGNIGDFVRFDNGKIISAKKIKK